MQLAETLLDERAAEWRRLPRCTPREQAAAAAYYDTQLLPLLRLEFAEREHARLPRRYEALILLVGADPTPAILSLATIEPKRVHVLFAAENEPVAADLLAHGQPLGPYERTAIDDRSILQAYAAVRDVHRNWGAPSATAVDISGGPPTLSAGAAMAAYAIGADLIAVESEEWWPELQCPRPGSQYLAFPAQPYVLFGDLARQEARRAYAYGDYGLAAALFAALAESAGAEYSLYQDLAAAYQAWDAFDLVRAWPPMSAVVRALRSRPTHPLAVHRDTLERQAQALARLHRLALQEEPSEARVMGRRTLVVDLAFSLQQAAYRRGQVGRYMEAILLLYRLLELLVQRRLALRGVRTVEPDYAALGVPHLPERLAALRAALLHQESVELEPPRQVGLAIGLLLLQLLDDPLAGAVDWDLLRASLPTRSRSILVHGYRWPSREQYQSFEHLLQPLLQRFCQAEGLDCAALNIAYRFVEI